MKVLLVSDRQDLKELLSFQISTRNPVTVRECKSAKEAVEILQKETENFGLLVAPYNGADSVLIKHLANLKDPLPSIFYFDPALI